MPKNCWEIRGCDEEMWSRCPHNGDAKGIYSPCPADCYYTACERPTHEVATDLTVLLDPSVDRMVAKKESCTFCTFFLTHAPKITAGQVQHMPAQTEQVLLEDAHSSAVGTALD
jgi:hypothetical protein